MPVNNLFMQSLLTAIEQQKANAAVISGAWHLALRSKDISAMTAVAGASNLPDDVLAAVKARNEIPVAVAYLTREGLSPEERKARLEAENRAGVLAGVLMSKSVTDADREVLAAKLIAKPTRALAEATIVDLTMPIDAVVVAISQLDPRHEQLTDTERSSMRRQVERCAKEKAAAAAVSRFLTVDGLAERLLASQPELTSEQFEDIFRRIYVPRFGRAIDRARNTVNTYSIVSDVRRIVGEDGTYHPDTVLKVLREQLDPEMLSKIWTEVVGATRAMADTADVSGHSARVLAARESTDTEELDSLVDEALAGNGALVEPLLRNMALDADQLGRVAAHVDHRTVARLPELRPGDEAAAMLAYLLNYERVVSSDGWKSFNDRRKAEATVLTHHIKMWEKERGSWYSGPAGTLMTVINDLEHVDMLDSVPWQFYIDMSQRYGTERLTGVVAQLQAEHLGADMRKWETAAVLSEGFAGTIGELFTAAAKL
jgi:hypothetical protein